MCAAAGQPAAHRVRPDARTSCRALPELHRGPHGPPPGGGLPRPVHAARRRRPALRRRSSAGPDPYHMRATAKMIPVLLFPGFDPVLVQVGPLAIRWYALAYIGSLHHRLAHHAAPRRASRRRRHRAAGRRFPHLGHARRRPRRPARLRAVLSARPLPRPPARGSRRLAGRHELPRRHARRDRRAHPYCRKHGIPLLGFADRLAVVVPIGLGLGRIANFINGELWGRRRRPGCPGP